MSEVPPETPRCACADPRNAARPLAETVGGSKTRPAPGSQRRASPPGALRAADDKAEAAADVARDADHRADPAPAVGWISRFLQPLRFARFQTFAEMATSRRAMTDAWLAISHDGRIHSTVIQSAARDLYHSRPDGVGSRAVAIPRCAGDHRRCLTSMGAKRCISRLRFRSVDIRRS